MNLAISTTNPAFLCVFKRMLKTARFTPTLPALMGICVSFRR
jgi:hypothetical protein